MWSSNLFLAFAQWRMNLKFKKIIKKKVNANAIQGTKICIFTVSIFFYFLWFGKSYFKFLLNTSRYMLK